MPSTFAKSGPSGSTIMKSSTLMKLTAPIRNTMRRSAAVSFEVRSRLAHYSDAVAPVSGVPRRCPLRSPR